MLRAQKSSQKSVRPRGAKDESTLPGAIGRNNACVRADAAAKRLRGEEASGARRGVYRSGWPASVPTPTAAGPDLVPNRGAGPSTWFVGLRSERRGWLCGLPKRHSPVCWRMPRRLAPRAPQIRFPRRGAAEYAGGQTGSRLILILLVTLCMHGAGDSPNH
jgi:hypothetical protein